MPNSSPTCRATFPLLPGICSLVVIWVLASGCSAGSGEGLDIAGRPLDEGGDLPLAPTLESIQSNIFNPFCIVCHAGAAASQGLRLDAANSFANLVGIPSREVASLLRVSPGNPGQSYLIRKLEDSASVGEQMPLDGPPLPQDSINFVRQWITEGAMPTLNENTSPPIVISVTPDYGSVVSEFPAQVLISFDQEVDASTVNAMTFRLTRSGGDGGFDDGNEEIMSPTPVSISSANTRLAVMDLAAITPAEDDYRIQMFGSGPNIVLNLNGAALDGEFAGSFPSGDGNEGGDFVSTFTVQGIQPTMASIQTHIFTPICSQRHTGPTGNTLPAGMDLSSCAASLGSLVNVPSIERPDLMRATP